MGLSLNRMGSSPRQPPSSERRTSSTEGRTSLSGTPDLWNDGRIHSSKGRPPSMVAPVGSNAFECLQRREEPLGRFSGSPRAASPSLRWTLSPRVWLHARLQSSTCDTRVTPRFVWRATVNIRLLVGFACAGLLACGSSSSSSGTSTSSSGDSSSTTGGSCNCAPCMNGLILASCQGGCAYSDCGPQMCIVSNGKGLCAWPDGG